MVIKYTIIEHNDEFQRFRFFSLQSIGELVEKLVKTLEHKGLLEDTYIIYTTDNGYHLSQHRLHAGKECGYDTDIHISLIIRGPGVAKGHTTDLVSSHTDLAPTIMQLAGRTREDFDSSTIPLDEDDILGAESEDRQEHISIEYWGRAVPEGKWGRYHDADQRKPDRGQDWGGYLYSIRNNTYKGLRLIGQDYNIYYPVWCTGDKESYDIRDDPGQLENYIDEDYKDIAAKRDSYRLAGHPFESIVDRLDALMMVLKSCKGDACRNPWNVLQPGRKIKTVKDALAHRHDTFYEEKAEANFNVCVLSYMREVEGPQHAKNYDDWEEERMDLRLRKSASFKYQGNPPWLV